MPTTAPLGMAILDNEERQRLARPGGSVKPRRIAVSLTFTRRNVLIGISAATLISGYLRAQQTDEVVKHG